MLILRNVLREYQDNEYLLKRFRITVENEFETFLNGIKDLVKRWEDEGDYELNDAHWECLFVEETLTVSLCNHLGIPINKFEKHSTNITNIVDNEGEEKEYIETIVYFLMDDIWNYLKSYNDFDFFVGVILISQLYEETEVIEFLASSGKKAMKQLQVKIPRYKKTVFVAMSFDKSLKKIRETICRVISQEGFTPIVIDAKEHNNQIVPEIFFEIDQAEFVIADLTQHKAGVYYEAGYAKGKGKDVIFTCSQEDSEGRHFDVAQTNTIFWKDDFDLMKRLAKRIEAMSLLVY